MKENIDLLKLDYSGLEISERYYKEYGKPMLEEKFPAYIDRIAVGLVGEGSECFGFDDLLSTDHDYGPSFCMWLTSEDYKKIGEALSYEYNCLPGDFMGRAARVDRVTAAGRVGVHEIGSFYRRFIGRPEAPKSLMEWLIIPESYLSVATNGKVFCDNLGTFSDTRNELLKYYPEDVRKKKLAKSAMKAAQSGQYNYGRMMRRGDMVTANLAVNEFITNVMSMIFLLNKVYTPYYKWRFRALEKLPLLSGLASIIYELSSLGSTSYAWSSSEVIINSSIINYGDKRVELMEYITSIIIKELKRQGLADGSSNYLGDYAYSIMSKIDHKEIRSLHILEG